MRLGYHLHFLKAVAHLHFLKMDVFIHLQILKMDFGGKQIEVLAFGFILAVGYFRLDSILDPGLQGHREAPTNSEYPLGRLARLAGSGRDEAHSLHPLGHGIPRCGDVNAFLDVQFDRAEDSLGYLAYPTLAGLGCQSAKELHVLGVEVQGVTQRQRLVVQGIDVAPEAALPGARLLYAEGEPSGGAQNRNGAGHRGV